MLLFLVKYSRPDISNAVREISKANLGHNAKLSQKTKHIDVKYHFVREYVEKGLIKIVFVKSEENDADIWTKNVKQETYEKHTSKFMKNMI